MRRPIPAVFQGSVATEPYGGTGSWRDIEPVLGASALLLASGAWILTFCLSGQPRFWLAVKIGCGVLLTTSLLGLWVRRKAAEAPALAVISVYQAVLRRASGGGGAIGHAPAEGGFAGLTGLIGDLATSLRRTQDRRAKLEAALTAGRSGVQEGRRQAQRVASEIVTQADAVSDAASQVGSIDLHLVREAESAARSLDSTDSAVTRAVEGIGTIAASIQATTSGARRMIVAASEMAEVAHGTHRVIATLDDKTARIVLALDTIEQAMQAVTSLAQAGLPEAAEHGTSRPGSARLASELREAAALCQPALADAGDAIRELIAQTTEATRRTMEIAELVGASHEIGRAVSHAVEQQGDEIARILAELYEARPGFATLRAGVEAVTLACTNRTDAADALQMKARALPSQAERLASILRGLPDLAPPNC